MLTISLRTLLHFRRLYLMWFYCKINNLLWKNCIICVTVDHYMPLFKKLNQVLLQRRLWSQWLPSASFMLRCRFCVSSRWSLLGLLVLFWYPVPFHLRNWVSKMLTLLTIFNLVPTFFLKMETNTFFWCISSTVFSNLSTPEVIVSSWIVIECVLLRCFFVEFDFMVGVWEVNLADVWEIKDVAHDRAQKCYWVAPINDFAIETKFHLLAKS